MPITMDTVLAELQRAVPGYQIDPEWLLDGRNHYLAFADFGRFICSEAEVLQYVESETEASQLSRVQPSMAFLERALRDGDQDVRDLVHDCIEGLAGCEWFDQIRKYFGDETRALWARYFPHLRE